METLTTTIEGVRAATGLGKTTVYRLINEGKLRTRKVGRRTLVTTESVKQLLEVAA